MFNGDEICIDKKATGARIRELRKACGLRVEDVSDFMGFMEPQAVYKWQRGESLPTCENLYRLSILFHTSMDNILRGTEPERDYADEMDFDVHIGNEREEDNELSSSRDFGDCFGGYEVA